MPLQFPGLPAQAPRIVFVTASSTPDTPTLPWLPHHQWLLESQLNPNWNTPVTSKQICKPLYSEQKWILKLICNSVHLKILSERQLLHSAALMGSKTGLFWDVLSRDFAAVTYQLPTRGSHFPSLSISWGATQSGTGSICSFQDIFASQATQRQKSASCLWTVMLPPETHPGTRQLKGSFKFNAWECPTQAAWRKKPLLSHVRTQGATWPLQNALL